MINSLAFSKEDLGQNTENNLKREEDTGHQQSTFLQIHVQSLKINSTDRSHNPR